MALFTKNNKKVETPKTKEAVSASVSTTSRMELAHVLKHPRITEKATINREMSVYVFNVASSASKNQIAQAVEKYYKVHPLKVRVVQVPNKRTRNMRTGVAGTTKKGKKAYVYLKKGDTITLA